MMMPYQYDFVASSTDDSDSICIDSPYFYSSHANGSHTVVKTNTEIINKTSLHKINKNKNNISNVEKRTRLDSVPTNN